MKQEWDLLLVSESAGYKSENRAFKILAILNLLEQPKKAQLPGICIMLWNANPPLTIVSEEERIKYHKLFWLSDEGYFKFFPLNRISYIFDNL